MFNAAIWGAGNIAETHARALIANNVNIKLVVDKTRQKARDFAQRFGAEGYSEDTQLLFAPDIDCVHICTPPALHYDMVKQLLLHDKNVLCEKPLCLSAQRAAELQALAEERALYCAVNFNVRFHLACQKARQLVQGDGFGRVLLIHGSYLQEFASMPCVYDWRYNPSLAGKLHAVSEIGSHWLDLAQYISGEEIVAVSAQFDKFFPKRYVEKGVMYSQNAQGREEIDVPSEDVAIISLRFKSGAIGVVTLSEISHGRYNYLSLEITGEKQSLWWNSENNNCLNYAEKGGTINQNVFAFGNGFTDTFTQLMQGLYSSIENKAKGEMPFPTFADGAHSVRLAQAILKSAEENSAFVTVNEEA